MFNRDFFKNESQLDRIKLYLKMLVEYGDTLQNAFKVVDSLKEIELREAYLDQLSDMIITFHDGGIYVKELVDSYISWEKENNRPISLEIRKIRTSLNDAYSGSTN